VGKNLPFLNVGCGSHYHQDWVNLDFASSGPGVIAHNLLMGIPFENNSFEVVYHSHVLEHFAKSDGKKFIQECFRVLKSGGILRIAIPDLQRIIGEYILLMLKLKESPDDPYLNASYDWILLELFDQTVRNKSGGEMVKFLQQDLINEDYVLNRCGHEIKPIIDYYRNNKQATNEGHSRSSVFSLPGKVFSVGRRIRKKAGNFVLHNLLNKNEAYYEIGKFRSSGEIHQWMYDEHSLTRLLKEIGFVNIKVRTAFDSAIEDWDKFGLETVDGKVRKPDSLFIEATK
jgi:predicted SAM-dependent methyltransferase